MKLMRNVYTIQVCSLKTATVKNGSDAKKCLKWAHIFVHTKRKRPSCACVTGVISDRLFFDHQMLQKTSFGNVNKSNFVAGLSKLFTCSQCDKTPSTP